MAEETKINLSDKELELVCNKEWILTKHIIIEKVYRLFGALAVSMQAKIKENFYALPEQATLHNPKISRGENYRSLPYVMLDFPRFFTKDAVLAIRTFFWWGNFFSISLHLSGACKDNAIPALTAHFTGLQNANYRLCINEDQWEHHFEPDNYIPLENFTAVEFADMLHREPFIKIAKRVSLKRWDEAEGFLSDNFNEMTAILAGQLPSR